MKYIKLLFLSVFALAFLAACDDDKAGPGDATVGFIQGTYSFGEKDGLQSIPLMLQGEPGAYPVSVDIEVTGVNCDVAETLTVTREKGLKIGPDNNTVIEFQIINNKIANADAVLNFTIVNVVGAEIDRESCQVTIVNDDIGGITVQEGTYRLDYVFGDTQLYNPNAGSFTFTVKESATVVDGYEISGLFGANLPQLVGKFDRTNWTLTFDGVDNTGASKFGYLIMTVNNNAVPELSPTKQWAIAMIGAGADGRQPIVFEVSSANGRLTKVAQDIGFGFRIVEDNAAAQYPAFGWYDYCGGGNFTYVRNL